MSDHLQYTIRHLTDKNLKCRRRIRELFRLDFPSKTEWEKISVECKLRKPPCLVNRRTTVIERMSRERRLFELREEWRVNRERLTQLFERRKIAKDLWYILRKRDQRHTKATELNAEWERLGGSSARQKKETRAQFDSRKFDIEQKEIRDIIDEEKKRHYNGAIQFTENSQSTITNSSRINWSFFDDPETCEPLLT